MNNRDALLAVLALIVAGAALPAPGGDRQMAAGAYARLIPKIDKQLNVAPELDLNLEATLRKDVVVVSVKSSKAKALANSATAKITATKLSPTAEAIATKCADDVPHKLKLHIALVEDRVRYVGENGIRFHSMTVRDMATPDGAGLALDGRGTGRATAKFELREVSARLKNYLTDYQAKESTERDKDKPFKFSAEPSAIDPKRLAVVAFIQDDATKSVLQSQMVSLMTLASGEAH